VIADGHTATEVCWRKHYGN